jgi:hypothetical protein
MVLTAEIPLLNDLNIPFTTNNGLYSSIPLLPTGVWAQGTTLKFDVENTQPTPDQTDTLTVTIPYNVTQDNIVGTLLIIINESESAFMANALGSLLLVARTGFTNPSGDTTNCTFTAVTITAP